MFFKTSKFFTILSLFAIPIVSKGTLFPFIVGKYAWFRGSVGLAFISFLLGLLFSPESGAYWERAKRVIRSPLGVAVGIFVATFLLAGFFGFDPANSFWSNFERGEGGIQIIHLYIFFVLLTALFATERGWRKVLGYAIFAGVLSSLYGFLASFGVSDFIGSSFKDGESYRFQGSLGNPSYVAVYAIFLFFYAVYFLVTVGKKELRRNFFRSGAIFVSVFLFIVIFYLAATRGAFLGLLSSLFLFSVFLMILHKKLRKPLAIAIVGGALVVGTLVYFKDTPFIKRIPGSRIFNISLSATTFGHRTIMWETALRGFKERPLLGWGPENYSQIFDRRFNTRYFNPPEQFGAWFDRAHSLVFDYLSETGILGLLSFFAIFAVYYSLFFKSVIRSIRNPGGQKFLFNSSVTQGLFFAMPAAYLIQGLVLFDILVIYMNLFLFMAFANYHFLSFSESIKNQHKLSPAN